MKWWLHQKFEEAFDEAVRNGASADELSKIRREFYKEGQTKTVENSNSKMKRPTNTQL